MRQVYLLCSVLTGSLVVLSTTSTPAGILNVVSGARTAYSLRLLDDNYTGDAIQVRRSSDNTTQGIGFDANGQLDTAALLSFVGSGNGYVTTWYDQAGSLDVSDGDYQNQPQIVRDGAVIVASSNDLPAVEFGAGQNNVLHATYSTPWLAENTIFTAGQFLSSPTNGNLTMRLWTMLGQANATRLSTGGDAVSDSPRLSVAYGSPFTCRESSYVLDTTNVLVTTTVVDATQAAGSDSLELFANGDSVLQYSNLSITQDDRFLALGGYDVNGINFGLNGYLQEIIFYDSLSTAQQQLVEGNLMGRYIPEPGTALLLVFGIFSLMCWRRRSR